MEHKLIQGGEQYLPFARSRIKAMRATGMQYASQRFSMGDAEVNVQIVGDHDYIRLSGGVYNILSGVVKAGTVIAGSPDVLRSFKPTEQCWTFPLKKREGTSPTAFHDEPILAINAHANVGVSGSQYTDLCSSMYSGLMAKAVQVILGIGKQKPTDDGVQVKYDYRWARCHGITIAADGKAWLIEISQAEGVLAMRLPIIKGTAGLGGNGQKVLSETVKLFKGIPSGGTFPAGAALTEAITAGTVLRLLTAAAMNTVYSKTAFSATLGWSFNDTGSEAHNTCTANVSSTWRGYHYRLDITIGPTLADRPENTPLAVATATLTEVGNGPLYGTARFKFYNSTSNTAAFYSTTTWPGGAEQSAPIFACHINGVLDVVRHCSNGTGSNTTTTNPGVLNDGIKAGTYFSLPYALVGSDDPLRTDAISSDMGPTDPINFAWKERTATLGNGQTFIRSARHPIPTTVGNSYRIDQTATSTYGTYNIGGLDYIGTFNQRVKIEKRARNPTAMMLRGVRDGYAFRKMSESRATVITSCYSHVAVTSPSRNVFVGVYENTTTFDTYSYESTVPPVTPTVPSPAKTYSTTSGPWIDEIEIVTFAGVETITQFHANQTASDNESIKWSNTNDVCVARVSSFGADPHILYSAPVPLVSFSTILSGTMLFSETNPSTTKYSFVGYI